MARSDYRVNCGMDCASFYGATQIHALRLANWGLTGPFQSPARSQLLQSSSLCLTMGCLHFQLDVSRMVSASIDVSSVTTRHRKARGGSCVTLSTFFARLSHSLV